MSEQMLPTLLGSRTEAEEKIRTQIQRGRQILVPIIKAQTVLGFGLDRAFEEAQVEQEKWAKFTIDLLKGLFNNHRIAGEFGSWFIEYPLTMGRTLDRFVTEVNARITRLESILERLPLYLAHEQSKSEVTKIPMSRDIFVVHGHDEAAKEMVARFVEKLGLHAIILHEKADKGRTIIEKFEDHSDVGFAVVLLTPDDHCAPQGKANEMKPRARQNVIFELGFFVGKLGRSRVCALRKGNVEIPTDYLGVLYIPMDEQGAWKLQLAKEIKQAGIEVDLNRAL